MPSDVNTQDVRGRRELGKEVPYGVYDIGANLGYVSLGIDHDTGQRAVNAVRLWLEQIGREAVSRHEARDEHGRRRRLQRFTLASVEIGEFDQVADEIGLTIQVCH